MSSGARIAFNDPRRFGMMKLVPRAALDQEPLLRALGPGPLGNEFDAGMLARACKGKKTSLKAALSDQKIVAGLGNIYVLRGAPPRAALAQAAGLHDRDEAGLSNERAQALVDAIKAMLEAAIEAGGSSLRDHRRTDGSSEISSTTSVSTTKGKPCPTAGCAAPSGAWCRPAARRSSARCQK